MMRHKTRLILAGVLVCASAFAGAAWWVASLGPPPLGKTLDFSTSVVDREGRLLRAYATSEGRWRLPATVADVDPRFFDVLFAYEDKRFREHHGVDPRAVLRATLQFATSGRLRSGASTLTMQVARLLGAARGAPQRGDKTAPDGARHRDRARPDQGRDPRALPRSRALRRQHRGHPRRVARLFRQRAAAAVARRSRALGGIAAIAGAAPAGSFCRECARRARPRARPLRRDRRGAGRRDRARQDRAGAERPPPDADIGAARRRQGRRRICRNCKCIG